MEIGPNNIVGGGGNMTNRTKKGVIIFPKSPIGNKKYLCIFSYFTHNIQNIAKKGLNDSGIECCKKAEKYFLILIFFWCKNITQEGRGAKINIL